MGIEDAARAELERRSADARARAEAAEQSATTFSTQETLEFVSICRRENVIKRPIVRQARRPKRFGSGTVADNQRLGTGYMVTTPWDGDGQTSIAVDDHGLVHGYCFYSGSGYAADHKIHVTSLPGEVSHDLLTRALIHSTTKILAEQ
jgi:hypothetical protein